MPQEIFYKPEPIKEKNRFDFDNADIFPYGWLDLTKLDVALQRDWMWNHRDPSLRDLQWERAILREHDPVHAYIHGEQKHIPKSTGSIGDNVIYITPED